MQYARFFAYAIAISWGMFAASPAKAQYRGSVSPYNPRPTVSPYLNLLQNNGSNLNLPQYQTLVRPFVEQQDFNNRAAADSQRLQRQVNTMQSQGVREAALRATGHPTRFMNYSHYYPNSR